MNRTTNPTASTAAIQTNNNNSQGQLGQVITTEQILSGLHNHTTPAGERLEEPTWTLRKIHAILDILLAGFDGETGENIFDAAALQWTIWALSDLTFEVENLLERWDDNARAGRIELEKRLDACSLIPVDSKVWGMMGAGKESGHDY